MNELSLTYCSSQVPMGKLVDESHASFAMVVALLAGIKTSVRYLSFTPSLTHSTHSHSLTHSSLNHSFTVFVHRNRVLTHLFVQLSTPCQQPPSTKVSIHTAYAQRVFGFRKECVVLFVHLNSPFAYAPRLCSLSHKFTNSVTHS